MMPFEEGSVNFLALIVILTNVFAFMFVIFLFIGRSQENKGHFFLGFLVLQYALYVFPDLLHIFGILDDFPHAVRIYVLGTTLTGPMTYFYIRTCTEESFKVTPKMWFHFLPFGIDFLFQLPFYTLNGADKLQYFYNFFIESTFQQPQWLTLAKIVLWMIYTIVSIRIVHRYRKQLANRASSIDAAFHRWLFLFCLVLLLPTIAALFYTFVDADFAFAFLLGSVFLTILTAFSLLIIKPSLFSRFPHQIVEVIPEEVQKEKYEKSNLQKKQKEKYIEKLQAYMSTSKPHLVSDLTLAQLSEQVNIPSYYLSQVINEKMNCNFIDFINSYRVEEVKEKLIDPKLSHYNVISIAYEAGFKAKSTFYAVFKKRTGMTANQYRKQFTLETAKK